MRNWAERMGIWPSSRSVTPLWQRVSLGETVPQLEDHPEQNLNPNTASIHLFCQLAPSLLPFSTSSTHCAWRKQIHLIMSGGQTGFRMRRVPKTSGAKFSDICWMAALGFWCYRPWCSKGAAGTALIQEGWGLFSVPSGSLKWESIELIIRS